jgi:hypothetical protein
LRAEKRTRRDAVEERKALLSLFKANSRPEGEFVTLSSISKPEIVARVPQIHASFQVLHQGGKMHDPVV